MLVALSAQYSVNVDTQNCVQRALVAVWLILRSYTTPHTPIFLSNYSIEGKKCWALTT